MWAIKSVQNKVLSPCGPLDKRNIWVLNRLLFGLECDKALFPPASIWIILAGILILAEKLEEPVPMLSKSFLSFLFLIQTYFATFLHFMNDRCVHEFLFWFLWWIITHAKLALFHVWESLGGSWLPNIDIKPMISQHHYSTAVVLTPLMTNSCEIFTLINQTEQSIVSTLYFASWMFEMWHLSSV